MSEIVALIIISSFVLTFLQAFVYGMLGWEDIPFFLLMWALTFVGLALITFGIPWLLA